MEFSMRIGIIGLGAMGWNHARVCRDLGLLAVASDPIGDARSRAAAAFGCRVEAQASAVLSDPDVDAVVVATPTSTHFSLVAQALTAGKHVLVEKPIAMTVAEGEAMTQQARDAGLVLAVGHIERHNPVAGFSQQVVASRRLGDLLSISTRRLSSMPGRIQDVGCILDIGIHDIDFACALAQAEPRVVFAQGGAHRTAPHEDYASIQIGFANGVTAAVETNWLTPMRVRKASLTLTDANVEADFVDQRIIVSTSRPLDPNSNNFSSIPTEYNHQVVNLRRQEPLRNELEDFARAVSSRTRPLVDGLEGIRALRVAQAAIESCRTGEAVNLGSAP